MFVNRAFSLAKATVGILGGYFMGHSLQERTNSARDRSLFKLSSIAFMEEPSIYSGQARAWIKEFGEPCKNLRVDPSVNFDEVKEIYHLPPFQKGLEPYANKIHQLKKDPNVMGIAFIPDQRSGQLYPIYIRRTGNQHTMTFQAYDLRSDKDLGYATVHPCLRSNNYAEGYYHKGLPKEYRGYPGSDQKAEDKLMLSFLINAVRGQYKNVGAVLIKAMLQHYEKSCECRLECDSAWGSQPFYYKLGFRVRSWQREMNRFFGCLSHLNQKTEQDLGNYKMHLPDAARRLWLDEIHQNPIRF